MKRDLFQLEEKEKNVYSIEFSDEVKRIEFDASVMYHENDRHRLVEARCSYWTKIALRFDWQWTFSLTKYFELENIFFPFSIYSFRWE